MRILHYHDSWDETVYGLAGVTTWTVAGREVAVETGGSLFIPRGTVHGFGNRSARAATFLTILSPDVLGPEYFQETAALVNGGGADFGAIKTLMRRHGLVPAG